MPDRDALPMLEPWEGAVTVRGWHDFAQMPAVIKDAFERERLARLERWQQSPSPTTASRRRNEP